MAHHLAQLIDEAEGASGNPKTVAEARAADLILRLWERRHDGYRLADPLSSCRDVVEVLSRLRAERNPWSAHRGRDNIEESLADLFDSMAKIVVGGIFLTTGDKLREISPAVEAALSPEEASLREHLTWWEAASELKVPVDLLPQLRIQFLPALESSSHDSDQDEASPRDLTHVGSASGDAAILPGDNTENELLDQPEETLPAKGWSKEQVTEKLEYFQAELACLVEAWKAKPG